MSFRTSWGEHERALPLAKAAAATSPLNPQILDTLGTVHLALVTLKWLYQSLPNPYAVELEPDSGPPRACSGSISSTDQADWPTLSAAKARDDTQGDDFEALVREESNLAP